MGLDLGAAAPADEGLVHVPYWVSWIPGGFAGVVATLEIMVAIVVACRRDPNVRMWAQGLAGDCGNRDRVCQVAQVQGTVRDTIKYLPDVRDVETIQTPEYTLRMGSGDCDDQSVLVASALESIGFQTRFCAIARHGGPFSHVSSQVKLGKGWVNLETILPALPFDWTDPGGNAYPAGSPVPIGWFPPDVSAVKCVRVP
jgi:hypothetical protein